MQKEQKHLEALFKKYQEGQVTEEEKELIAQWLIQLDLKKDLLPQHELEQREVSSRAQLRQYFFPNVTSKPAPLGFSFWLRSAAAVLLISGLGVILFKLQYQAPVRNPVTYTELTANTGEIKTIVLTDGTRVTLNHESKLRYPNVFAGKTREVTLVGQAFFEVAHKANKPFKVHTALLNVQVLGTSFDVEAYPEDPVSDVMVVTGKVGVMAPKVHTAKTYMLLPGEGLSFNHLSGKFKHGPVDVLDNAAWKQGLLVFNNQRLENIILQLKKAYKVKFVFRNKALLDRELNLKIKNENLNVVMKALSIPGEFKYQIEKDTVTLW